MWPNRSFISVSIKKCTNSVKWKPFLKAWLISHRSNNFRRLNPFDCMFLSCPRTPFQSESTLYSCLNVKELLARSRREIWRWSDCNWTRTKNHLIRKRTLNHLAKLTKWFSCVLSNYLYDAFGCMFSSCHVRVSEWIHTISI